MDPIRPMPRFTRALRQMSRARITPVTRPAFSTAARLRVDGVYKELTTQRVELPWIEAFRMQDKPHDGQLRPDLVTTGNIEDRDLSPKRMQDSYHSVVIPLGQDPWLLDSYANDSGHIRLGTIFMDLDALSGVVAYKYTGDSVMTVTAAFDRITINHALHEICDLRLSGMVTHTGRSSMEVSLRVARAPKEGEEVKPEDVMITCQCTMVSLDPRTKKPVQIPPLVPQNEEERRIFDEGEKNNKSRKERARRSLLNETPNDEESDLVHAIWLRDLKYRDPNDTAQKPTGVQYMDKTRLHTAAIMQPQYRNRHHFVIFGGFLLKQTFELAFCCAASFARKRPTFVSLDPSTFENPVPVGSVLYMTATVVYTDPPLVHGASDGLPDGNPQIENQQTRIQVRVDTRVRNVEHGQPRPTGQFHYTFTVDEDIKVMPRTYSEYMMYIDARRRVKEAFESIRDGDADAGVQERVTE